MTKDLLPINQIKKMFRFSGLPIGIFNLFRISGFVICFVQLIAVQSASAQHIFREKLTLCNATPFVMETDTTTAKVADTTFVRIIKQCFDPRIKTVIQGKLLLQILVDQRGRSCLLSYENNTNLPNHVMKLEETINKELMWSVVSQVTCAVVRVTITKDEITIKRLGINQNKTWIELPR